MESGRGRLWVNRDFIKLWLGQSISQFGAQITLLALPLAAAHELGATPLQMGTLRSLEYVPFLLFGLFAGVVVDRRGCRNILITSDLVRALFLAMIPLAALCNQLNMGLLYIVAFAVGVAGVFFDVAYWSYLPTLVRHTELSEGNNKLGISQSAAQVAGPGVAGVLIQLATPPIAIAVNAVSFLVSAVSIVMIRKTDVPTVGVSTADDVFRDMIRGFTFVWGEQTLKSLMIRATAWNFLHSFAMPSFILYCTAVLKLSTTLIGLLFTCMGLGLGAGSFLMATTFSGNKVGNLICGSMFVAALGTCTISIQFNQTVLQVALLMLSLFVIGAATGVYSTNNISLRQALTPSRLLGRMTAAMRFVSWGVMPVGALLSGLLSDLIGFPATLLLTGCVGLVFALIGYAGPVRQIATLPVEPAKFA